MTARTFRVTALTGALAMLAIVSAASPAAASSQRYVYTVHDSKYGSIGTYSNVIEKTGDATTITTEAHIRVTFLGITLYRQEASRIERWVDDRLVYFHGVTTENGEPTEVEGKAEAGNFIVSSPKGKVTAPGTIRSANPWSAAAEGGDMLLMPDTGLVEKVNPRICEATFVTIDGASTQAQRCQIETSNGGERYEVWTDGSGAPVMFNIKDVTSTVTFTLIK